MVSNKNSNKPLYTQLAIHSAGKKDDELQIEDLYKRSVQEVDSLKERLGELKQCTEVHV